jgi:hypothetical protein
MYVSIAASSRLLTFRGDDTRSRDQNSMESAEGGHGSGKVGEEGRGQGAEGEVRWASTEVLGRRLLGTCVHVTRPSNDHHRRIDKSLDMSLDHHAVASLKVRKVHVIRKDVEVALVRPEGDIVGLAVVVGQAHIAEDALVAADV